MDTRSEFAAFLGKLQGPDLYKDFDISSIPVDDQGFQSSGNTKFFQDVFREFKPQTLLEFGSWKGTSAIMFARLMRAICENPVIACVDTWLGSMEHWSNPEFKPHLLLRNGYPRLYEVFLANIIRAEVSKYVTPLPMTTNTFLRFGHRHKIRVDMVYLDASHEYAEVMQDLHGVWGLLSPEGVLIADDYKAPQVAKAIQEFCARPGVFGVTNANVPWPEALIVKTAAMRDRAVAAHSALVEIPKP